MFTVNACLECSYLKEDLSKDPVSLLSEDCGENNGDTIRRCLDIDRLFVAVVQSQKLSLPSSRSSKLLLCGKRQLKRGRQSVALEQGDRLDQRITFLCLPLVETRARKIAGYVPPSGGNRSKSSVKLTLYSGSGCVFTRSPYSLRRTLSTPYLTSSSQHRILIESVRQVLRSGVDKWNRTPSKSTNWTSRDVGLFYDEYTVAGGCAQLTDFCSLSASVVWMI